MRRAAFSVRLDEDRDRSLSASTGENTSNHVKCSESLRESSAFATGSERRRKANLRRRPMRIRPAAPAPDTRQQCPTGEIPVNRTLIAFSANLCKVFRCVGCVGCGSSCVE
jgi:hypothetical protein